MYTEVHPRVEWSLESVWGQALWLQHSLVQVDHRTTSAVLCTCKSIDCHVINSGVHPPTVPKCWAVGKLSGKSFCRRKFLYRSAKYVTLKPPFWGNLGAKLKFSAPVSISSVGFLQVSVGIPWEICSVCRKIANFYAAYFSTHDAAAFTYCITVVILKLFNYMHFTHFLLFVTYPNILHSVKRCRD